VPDIKTKYSLEKGIWPATYKDNTAEIYLPTLWEDSGKSLHKFARNLSTAWFHEYVHHSVKEQCEWSSELGTIGVCKALGMDSKYENVPIRETYERAVRFLSGGGVTAGVKVVSALMTIGEPDKEKVRTLTAMKDKEINRCWKNLERAGAIREGKIAIPDINALVLCMLVLVADSEP
jgi:hypothetical protein